MLGNVASLVLRRRPSLGRQPRPVCGPAWTGSGGMDGTGANGANEGGRGWGEEEIGNGKMRNDLLDCIAEFGAELCLIVTAHASRVQPSAKLSPEVKFMLSYTLDIWFLLLVPLPHL